MKRICVLWIEMRLEVVHGCHKDSNEQKPVVDQLDGMTLMCCTWSHSGLGQEDV